MSNDPIVYVVDDDQAMVESLSWVIESVGLKVAYTRAQEFWMLMRLSNRAVYYGCKNARMVALNSRRVRAIGATYRSFHQWS